MNRDEVLSKVTMLLKEQNGLWDDFTEDMDLVNEAGLDSLDQVEIFVKIEDEFGININDKAAEEFWQPRNAPQTPRKLAELVEQYL